MSAAPLSPALRSPVVDLQTGKDWLASLVAAGLAFHLEDDPADIINGATGAPIFREEDCAFIREQVAALYRQDWGAYDCPIGYLLAYERQAGLLDFWTLGEGEEYENGQLARVAFVGAGEARAFAVLQKGDRFEPAYRDMPLSAQGAWTNPLEDEGDFSTLDAARSALLDHITKSENSK